MSYFDQIQNSDDRFNQDNQFYQDAFDKSVKESIQHDANHSWMDDYTNGMLDIMSEGGYITDGRTHNHDAGHMAPVEPVPQENETY